MMYNFLKKDDEELFACIPDRLTWKMLIILIALSQIAHAILSNVVSTKHNHLVFAHVATVLSSDFLEKTISISSKALPLVSGRQK